jgi:hypothetical protein
VRFHFTSMLGAIIVAMAFISPAKGDESVTSAPVTDPTQVAAHYHQVASRPEFTEPTNSDVDERMRDWFSQWLTGFNNRFGQFQYAQQLPQFASLLLALLALLSMVGLSYVLVRLTRRRLDWRPSVLLEDAEIKPSHPPEFYEEELRQAVSRGDWRSAWLANWRHFLSLLEKGRLVEADRTRTNREYLAQLQAKALPASTAVLLDRVMDAYDRFIYGCQTITETDWKSFHQQIRETALLLHLQEPQVTSEIAIPAS